MKRLRRHVGKSGKITYFWLDEHIFNGSHDGHGYLHVKLSKDCKQRLFKKHVLVAMAFLGYTTENYDRKNVNSLVIDHKNSIKDDNRLSNLQIISQRENIRLSVERRRKKQEK